MLDFVGDMRMYYGKMFHRPSWLTYLLLLVVSAAVAAIFWVFHTSVQLPSGAARDHNMFTIIYTMDTNGYLQSCGCVAQQVGGLAKRATMIHSIRENGLPILLIDGGNLAADLPRSQVVMDFLKLMQYQVVGLGELDIQLGEDFYQQARQRELPLTAHPLPKGSPFHSVAPYKLCSVGTRRVAVLRLLKGFPDRVFPLIRTLLQEIRPQADLVVVLSSLDFATEKKLVSAVGLPGLIDLVIGMRGSSQQQPVVWDDVTFIPASVKGEVGVVNVALANSNKPVFSHRMEVVRDTLMPDPEVQDLVGSYFAQEAQQLLAGSQSFSLDWSTLRYQPPSACVECHESQMSLWQTSKHAHASRTLQAKGRMVPECLQCHSELFRRSNKFNPSLEAAWNGVECATCHGDGILHTVLRNKQSITRKVMESTCRRCHDRENDPDFDYSTYLEKIRHW